MKNGLGNIRGVVFNLIVMALPVLILTACSEDDATPTEATDPIDTNSIATDTLLTVSPLPVDSVSSFAPLGNLNPSGHVFPTDHCYMYMVRDSGASAPRVVTLYCPGTLRLTEIAASEHVNAAMTDYGIRFELQTGVSLELGHVSTLQTSVFGDVSSFAGFTLINEYSTGGETYRMWRKAADTVIAAGSVLGTAGGNPGQWALDIGVYDERITNTSASAAGTWQNSPFLHAVCPLEYYAAGAVKDSLYAIVQRDSVFGDSYPCGWIAQDVAGSAQGIWFHPDSARPYPEDPHMALVWHSQMGARQVISMGKSVPALPSGTYMFDPTTSGRLNRRFDQVGVDGIVYGYHVTGGNPYGPRTAIVEMIDSISIRVDALTGHIVDSSLWVFSDSAMTFVR